MQKMLGDFIHALRHAGLPISPAETLDALHAAKLIGFHNPTLLKSGLGMTLAKNKLHLALFEVCFDQFFSKPSLEHNTEEPILGTDPDNNTQPAALNSESSDTPTTPSPSLQFPEPEPPSLESVLANQLASNDQVSLQMAIANAAEQAGAGNMQMFTQKGIVSYRIMQSLGEADLNAELAQLEQNNEQPELTSELRNKQQILRQQVKDYVEEQFLLFSENIGRNLRDAQLQKVRLSNIDYSYYQDMSKLVKKAAKQLASLHSRRRKVTKRGLLDVRKTLAANAAYDGFLFHTKWKSTRIDKPKVMVICDVSGSVSKVARFLLLFLYSLQDVLPRVRSFVFASSLAEVTDDFDNKGIEDALTHIMNHWANSPTDYGQALLDFKDIALRDIDNKTTVIMLGDARNNHGLAQTQIWQQVYQRSQRVLWLNPEGRYSWDSGDSIMGEYRPYCSRVEPCRSLNDLTRVLGSLLKHS